MQALIGAIERIMPEVLKDPVLRLSLEQRSKFEKWMQVELGAALTANGFPVRLEQQYRTTSGRTYRADMAVVEADSDKKALIMLKTVNTNFRFDGVEKRHRPITRNVSGVIEDIHKLENLPDGADAYVLFAVFPVSAMERTREDQLRIHLDRILAQKAALLVAGFVPRHRDWGIIWCLFKVGG